MDMMIAKQVNRFGIHPQKFALWAALASIAMMFASLTSAYVVREGLAIGLNTRSQVSFLQAPSSLLLSSFYPEQIF
jgi:cytochrome c oxidase subunit 3